MKVLLVEFSIDGHSLTYISKLAESDLYEAVLVVPEKIKTLNCKQYELELQEHKNPLQYFKWIVDLKKIIKKEKPDVVHLLYGDNFYRYCGLGLRLLGKNKTILTLHWIKGDKFHKISTKSIAHRVKQIIVHSDYMKNQLKILNINNAERIEYPYFSIIQPDKIKAKEYFDLKNNIPVLCCLGSARYDKGLDILLDSLKNVKEDFQLLIAGTEGFFDKQYVNEHISSYKDKVKINMRFLSEEEFAYASEAADIIVLPYRKIFSGASGPLGEGVWKKKCIIGPMEGNLGYTIKKYHLGYVFESENTESLSNVLNIALSKKFEPDMEYLDYRKMLNPDIFVENYYTIYKGMK